jgi:UDP-2,3-diacylglucosamine hydrolase
LEIKEGKKIYFASDLHLGLHPKEKSKEREKQFVHLLDEMKNDAQEIFLLGDIFDFWHEYKKVIPKGFTRFLGKVAEITDSGIPVHFFTGNHDVWMYDYFPKELGVTIHRKPIERVFDGKKFILGHGDGVGPGDKHYKFLKRIFTNSVLQWLFSRLHPNFALWIGHSWSKHSRYSKGIIPEKFLSEEKEFQVLYAKEMIKQKNIDYIIFGHRHLPMIAQIGEKTKLINLGDWIYNFSFGYFDGHDFSLDSIIPERKKEIIHKKIEL